MQLQYNEERIAHLNKKGLRLVETSFDIERINQASKNGATCVFRNRTPNPALSFTGLILRNKTQGDLVVVPDRIVYQQYGRGVKRYDHEDWETVQEFQGYARVPQRSFYWGAYIVPVDAMVGERFFISELIEDLLAANFFHTKIAAETAEATWDGSDLVIDPSSYRRELVG